jgi:CheY-like chemotaxis protein
MLEAMGYKPDIANNGTQAIEMAANNYDLIFMDIGLPDINGFAATVEIRRRESGNQKRAFIIGLTGYLLEEVQAKCLEAGMDNVAAKPITTEQLQRIINQKTTV